MPTVLLACAPRCECSGWVGRQVYAGPLSGGARAVVLLNRHDATDPKNFPAHNLTVYWESIGLPAMEAVRGNTLCCITVK